MTNLTKIAIFALSVLFFEHYSDASEDATATIFMTRTSILNSNNQPCYIPLRVAALPSLESHAGDIQRATLESIAAMFKSKQGQNLTAKDLIEALTGPQRKEWERQLQEKLKINISFFDTQITTDGNSETRTISHNIYKKPVSVSDFLSQPDSQFKQNVHGLNIGASYASTNEFERRTGFSYNLSTSQDLRDIKSGPVVMLNFKLRQQGLIQHRTDGEIIGRAYLRASGDKSLTLMYNKPLD